MRPACLAVVVARFNAHVTSKLYDGCRDELGGRGLDLGALTSFEVPGCFELAVVAKELASSGRFDAVIWPGRGDPWRYPPHFDYVSSGTASGLQRAALDTGVPVIFGVLTTDNEEQALVRVVAAPAGLGPGRRADGDRDGNIRCGAYAQRDGGGACRPLILDYGRAASPRGVGGSAMRRAHGSEKADEVRHPDQIEDDFDWEAVAEGEPVDAETHRTLRLAHRAVAKFGAEGQVQGLCWCCRRRLQRGDADGCDRHHAKDEAGHERRPGAGIAGTAADIEAARMAARSAVQASAAQPKLRRARSRPAASRVLKKSVLDWLWLGSIRNRSDLTERYSRIRFLQHPARACASPRGQHLLRPVERTRERGLRRAGAGGPFRHQRRCALACAVRHPQVRYRQPARADFPARFYLRDDEPFLKPIVSMVSCALTCVTLGLFALLINTAMLALTAWVAGALRPGVPVDRFTAAFLARW